MNEQIKLACVYASWKCDAYVYHDTVEYRTEADLLETLRLKSEFHKRPFRAIIRDGEGLSLIISCGEEFNACE